MANNIFRKKSLDRVSSPDQLNEYVKVANPSVWAVLLAVLLLVIGVIVWSICGRLETSLNAKAKVTDEVGVCLLTKKDGDTVKKGQKLVLDNKDYLVDYVLEKDTVNETFEVGFLAKGLSNGEYEARIVTESIAPISFLFN